MKQAFNPYLPSYEYVPDGEPHLFGGRVYVYGSHDLFGGASFCLGDYVCWSTPENDLSDWRYEGVIYRRMQDPLGKKGVLHALYAPDVCRGEDGRYYLYYTVGYQGLVSVAVCDEPAGSYEFYGFVRYGDGTPVGRRKEPLQYDPAVFADDDGRRYLYTGFGPVAYPAFLLGGHKPSKHGAMCFELERDMLTVKGEFTYLGVKGRAEGKGTPYEGHEFFEASSMRKFDGKYYFIYSSFRGHELCYAVSDEPSKGFEFGGTLVSVGDVGICGRTEKSALSPLGNTHGSVIRLGGRYYVFYHRHTNRNAFSRQACAEEIVFENGKFRQAEVTSCGLNGAPLQGTGTYPAYIACGLYSERGSYFSGVMKKPKGRRPYLTQSGKDRECGPDQYIANFCGGSTALFRSFSLDETGSVAVTLRGRGGGTIEVRTRERGEVCAELPVPVGRGERTVKAPFVGEGVMPLYFTYRGRGSVEFLSFTLGPRK